jgi:hypothetical protein
MKLGLCVPLRLPATQPSVPSARPLAHMLTDVYFYDPRCVMRNLTCW